MAFRVWSGRIDLVVLAMLVSWKSMVAVCVLK